MDRLDRLLSAAEHLTVELISQQPVTVQPGAHSPQHARHLADSEQFDLIPLREPDGRIVRFVRRTALDADSSSSGWDGIETEVISPDDIVSAATPILELVPRFDEERPHLFVIGPRGIDGIVTVFDLNQPAAHHFGFALCLVVEAALSRAIEDALRQTKDDLDVDVDQRIRTTIRHMSREEKDIRSRAKSWDAKLAAGTQVRLTQELVFDNKVLLVQRLRLQNSLAERWREPYGPDGDGLLTYLRKEVRALRNAVAHDGADLADEWKVWRWMRTTIHLADDLHRSTKPAETSRDVG